MKYDEIDYSAFPNAPKPRSVKRRELNDQKLTEEFSKYPRFARLDWYVDPSTESRHRCLVFTCTCGKEMKLLPHSIRRGYNPELLCPACVTPIRRRGKGSINPKYKED